MWVQVEATSKQEIWETISNLTLYLRCICKMLELADILDLSTNAVLSNCDFSLFLIP